MVVRDVARSLSVADIDDAPAEARRLVLAACGLAPVELIRAPERQLTPAEHDAIAAHLARRCRREPLARILGEREFYGRPFHLSPATLEPRPDTETLIEAVLGMVRARELVTRPPRILDLGTGTGCILLTLLAELPEATGLGIDIAADAVFTARANAMSLGLAARADFEVQDGPSVLAGPFDIVVSNPPYIAAADIEWLAPEVRDFDPPEALDGGADGLDFYRSWIPHAVRLSPRGIVAMEVGAGQADAVAGLLARAAGLPASSVRSWRDLAGHTRVVAIETH